MNARERLAVMVRTNQGSMTVWSPDQVRDALDAYRAEVLAEAATPALDALRLIHADMVTCRSGGDEWASEWLGDLWTRLPLALRAAAGDKDAAEELADEAATGGAS